MKPDRYRLVGDQCETKKKIRPTETTNNENGGFFGVGHFECERKKKKDSPQVQENERGERQRTGEGGGGLIGQSQGPRQHTDTNEDYVNKMEKREDREEREKKEKKKKKN